MKKINELESMKRNKLLRFGIVRYLGSKTHKPRYLTKDGFWTTDREICGWFTDAEVAGRGLSTNEPFEMTVYLNHKEIYKELYNGKIQPTA
jgi:hypothetical protein